MWNKKEHDFGSVSQGTVQRTIFEYTGNKEILEIEPLCSCVGFKFENNNLMLSWKIRDRVVTSYQSTKIIAIIYADGSIDDLTLTAYIEV